MVGQIALTVNTIPEKTINN